MESNDSVRFDVFFAGQVIDGHEAAAVREALARLFKADDKTLDRLFSGQHQRIKAQVDRAMAQRYEEAMRKAGALAIIQPAAGAATPAATPAPRTETRADSGGDATDDTGFDLAPAGADMLREDERQRSVPAAPSTEHLSVASAGEDLAPPREEIISDVHAPDLELAAPGSSMSTGTPTAAPDAPDTSGISLALPDHDLSDCAPSGAPPAAVDTDHLALAQTGSDLLDESERRRDDAVAPNTDHITLAPDSDPVP